MDCMVTTALKSCLHKDMAFKSTTHQPPFYFDDIWLAGGGGLNNLPSDDFSVDDLLDFSGKDFSDGTGEEEEGGEEKASILEVASLPRSSNSSSSFSENDQFGSLLAAPADDLESLEWLSQFVDDSQSQLSMLCAADGFNSKTGGSEKNRIEPVVQKRNGPFISQPVPKKPRSIRQKPLCKSWSGTTSLAIESSSFSSSSSYGSSTMSPFVFANPVQDFELVSSVEKPPHAKKQKKKKTGSETGSGSSGSQSVLRKCSHCQVQKTPQWRAGPLGPKTLCNACGVRFKSGRLFPEYRPACSPTFSLEVHSNSHRKVLEMRKKKDPVGPTNTGLGWSF